MRSKWEGNSNLEMAKKQLTSESKSTWKNKYPFGSR